MRSAFLCTSPTIPHLARQNLIEEAIISDCVTASLPQVQYSTYTVPTVYNLLPV